MDENASRNLKYQSVSKLDCDLVIITIWKMTQNSSVKAILVIYPKPITYQTNNRKYKRVWIKTIFQYMIRICPLSWVCSYYNKFYLKKIFFCWKVLKVIISHIPLVYLVRIVYQISICVDSFWQFKVLKLLHTHLFLLFYKLVLFITFSQLLSIAAIQQLIAVSKQNSLLDLAHYNSWKICSISVIIIINGNVEPSRINWNWPYRKMVFCVKICMASPYLCFLLFLASASTHYRKKYVYSCIFFCQTNISFFWYLKLRLILKIVKKLLK